MALTEEEQRKLAALEAALAADDPHLADTLRGERTIVVDRHHLLTGGLLLGVGVILLVVGLATHPSVSILGFIAMLVGGVLALSSWRETHHERREVEANPLERYFFHVGDVGRDD